jgi:membrane-bound lytic murein transglycosylase B
MLSRRTLIASSVLLPLPALAQEGSYAGFLDGVRAEARRAGISEPTLRAAPFGATPNAHVLELDRHQPEFTLTWAQYRAKVLPQSRLVAAREAFARHRGVLTEVWQRYGVDPRVIVGIWGLESNFGARTGGFNVVEALATLAYDGRRASFFRAELMSSLRILDHGDVSPQGMTGSYAGAMGQPQFMPSSYLRYAVDFTGDGQRNIWTSLPDVFASVGNYLGRSGWKAGEIWGQPVRVPAGLVSPGGRDDVRPLGQWERDGVRREDGAPFRPEGHGTAAALLLPDGTGGDAFLVYGNFKAIRRYNPSDFYALAVGLLGDAAAA